MEEEPEKEPQQKIQQQLEGAIEGSVIKIESQATSSWQSQSQQKVCLIKMN
jgi:hypothetical protein